MEPSQYGQYGPPAPASSSSGGAPAAPTGRPRARIGLIVLTAVLSEIVLIAAGANQWSAKQMAKADGQVRYYLLGWLTYTWRVSAPHGANKTWAAQFALIGTVLVLTAALVWCLLRGPVSWGRAFFGTWLAVLFATVAGAIVRGLVQPLAPIRGNTRVTAALFGFNGPSSSAVFGGLVLGLVVGVITGVIAVVSRRPVAGAVPAETGPPQFADYGPPAAAAPAHLPPWQDQQFASQQGGPSYAPASGPGGAPAGPAVEPPAAPGQPADGDAATTALPRLGDERPAGPGATDEATTQMPVVPPGGEAPGQAAAGEQRSGQERATEQPAGEQPATEQPATEQPATEQPATERPASEQPASEQPASEQPPSEQPPSEQPTVAHDAPAESAPAQPAPAESGPAQPPTDQPTTQMPVVPPAQPGEQATTRFPRPPDDEDLGHIDH